MPIARSAWVIAVVASLAVASKVLALPHEDLVAVPVGQPTGPQPSGTDHPPIILRGYEQPAKPANAEPIKPELAMPAATVQAGLSVPEAATSSKAENTVQPRDRAPRQLESCPSQQQNCRVEICSRLKPSWNGHWKQRVQEKWAGHPDESEEPFGSFILAHRSTQVAKGQAAQMVLYRYDFVEGHSELNTRGKRQLNKFAELLPKNFSPIIIEPNEHAPNLNETRRQFVLNKLNNEGSFPVPPERVRVDLPSAVGLNGRHAELLSKNIFKQTEAGGAVTSQAGAAAGGSSRAAGAGVSASEY